MPWGTACLSARPRNGPKVTGVPLSKWRKKQNKSTRPTIGATSPGFELLVASSSLWHCATRTCLMPVLSLVHLGRYHYSAFKTLFWPFFHQMQLIFFLQRKSDPRSVHFLLGFLDCIFNPWKKRDTFSCKETVEHAEWLSFQLTILVVCSRSHFKVVQFGIISAMRHLHDQMNHIQNEARFRKESAKSRRQNQTLCNVAPPSRVGPVRVCGGLRGNKTLEIAKSACKLIQNKICRRVPFRGLLNNPE